VVDSCLEQQSEAIKPCLNKFWVDLNGLGLEFAMRMKRERREERERKKKMSEPVQYPFI